MDIKVPKTKRQTTRARAEPQTRANGRTKRVVRQVGRFDREVGVRQPLAQLHASVTWIHPVQVRRCRSVESVLAIDFGERLWEEYVVPFTRTGRRGLPRVGKQPPDAQKRKRALRFIDDRRRS